MNLRSTLRSPLVCCLLPLLAACAAPPAASRKDAPLPLASASASNAGTPVASASVSEVASAAPEPAEPPPPPYDLGADLEERRTKLTKIFGAKVKFLVVEDVFLLVSPSGTLGRSTDIARMAITAYFNDRFATRPKRALSVLLFESAPPYEAHCKLRTGEACGTPFGFYVAADRTIVMNAGPGLGTLTHELVHPIVEADFPKAPDWINEGIASLYEGFTFLKPGEIRGVKNWRHPGLVVALRAKDDKPTLPALFAMSNGVFRGEQEGRNYAHARYFCQWMESQGKLWAFYQAWRDGYATDPTGVAAFTKVMGKSPADLNAAWTAWVLAL
jgi:hypothetical protein